MTATGGACSVWNRNGRHGTGGTWTSGKGVADVPTGVAGFGFGFNGCGRNGTTGFGLQMVYLVREGRPGMKRAGLGRALMGLAFPSHRPKGMRLITQVYGRRFRIFLCCLLVMLWIWVRINLYARNTRCANVLYRQRLYCDNSTSVVLILNGKQFPRRHLFNVIV